MSELMLKPTKDLCLMTNLNSTVPSIMLKMVLPKMLSTKLGLCIMVGSGAGLAPFACISHYSATKAYVVNLTKALRV